MKYADYLGKDVTILDCEFNEYIGQVGTVVQYKDDEYVRFQVVFDDLHPYFFSSDQVKLMGG